MLSSMHVPSNKWMAIKEISIDNAVKCDMGLSMISKEVEVLTALGERSFIVKLFCAFHDNKNMYIALELHKGGDLRFHIAKNKFLNEKMAAHVIICIADALHFIHSKGILHRDVKPENIVLSPTGVPHLTDFGVSYMHEEASEIICYKSSGTKQYLAPEVFTRSNRHGVESDFWSLGIVLYEIIYSHRPFSKHCPSAMIDFQEDLYREQVFFSSTSLLFADQGTDSGRRISPSTPPLTCHNHSYRHSQTLLTLKQSLESLKEEDIHAMTPPSEETKRLSGSSTTSSTDENNDDDDDNIHDEQDDEEAWTTHLLRVSKVIRNSPLLKVKLRDLQKKAASDLVLDIHDNGFLSPDNECEQQMRIPFHRSPPLPSQYNTRLHLPKHLRPSCAHNTKLGTLSPACEEVIEGLLDVRLWTRLGAGSNYRALRTHPWFQQVGLDWNDVISSRVPPPLVPDTAHVAETLANTFRYHYMNNSSAKSSVGNNEPEQLPPPLTVEDIQILKDFHYVDPSFKA